MLENGKRAILSALRFHEKAGAISSRRIPTRRHRRESEHCPQAGSYKPARDRYTSRVTTSRIPNPLLSVLGGALESALNAVMALDPEQGARLRALDGRAIELLWSGPELGLRLSVADGRLRVGPRESGEPDLAVSGTLSGFIGMLLPRRGGAGVPTGKVRMNGDAELARHLSKLAEQLAPDFDAAFTRAFGAGVGPMLARGVRGALSWARSNGRTLAEDAADYLREESGDVVDAPELKTYVDVERLAARVARLKDAQERQR
jgi:ubiquinone biosynthesis accessory factor UbiJ